MKIRMVKCSDIGIDGCNYMAIGNNLDEVEQNMFEHIDTEHKDILDSMTEHQVHHLKHR
ncbi:MAG: hypothetical protein PWQ44_2144, partial [Methanolobus sp.]|nr:hypothetical protein [Methanolobus sp.]